MVVTWAALVLSLSRGGLLAMSIQMIFAGLLFLNSRNPRRNPVATARGSDTRARVTAKEGQPPTWLRSTIAKAIMIGVLLITTGAGVSRLDGEQLLPVGATTAP